MLSTPQSIELKIGAISLQHKLTPVPSSTPDKGMEWMYGSASCMCVLKCRCYFNINDSKFTAMVEETTKLVAERILSSKHRIVVVAPESAPIAISHLLRQRYGIAVHNMSKKKRPHMGPDTLREDYSAVTSTEVNSLYFGGMDDEIGFRAELCEVVLFDNVVTTGGTFGAAARLLRRFYPNIKVREAIVMWTEGYQPFSNIAVDGDWVLPIHSLGGHIPIFADERTQPLSPNESTAPSYRFVSSAPFPTYYSQHHNIQFNVFENKLKVPAVAVIGPNTFQGPPPDGKWQDVTVRVHDACLTSECFRSCKCDCREQLEQAMRHISTKGGMLIYLFQEGRGIGLGAKMKAYFLQTMALLDTFEANRALELPDDARSYGAVRDILNHFQVASIKLMSNNPWKLEQIELLGIKVTERISAQVVVENSLAASYQLTKALTMGHCFTLDHFSQYSIPTPNLASTVIRFYEPEDEYGFMSNFYASPVTIESTTFATVEHFYQSRKFKSREHEKLDGIYELVKNAPTPAESFRLAREHDKAKRSDWDARKKLEMFRGLLFKFKQHDDLRERLIATGDVPLIENSPVDTFWGCGSDGTGKNYLGLMLANVRSACRDHDLESVINLDEISWRFQQLSNNRVHLF